MNSITNLLTKRKFAFTSKTKIRCYRASKTNKSIFDNVSLTERDFDLRNKKMADYKESFEKWQRAAKEKFDELDKQLGIKDKIEESAKVLQAKEDAGRIKTEAEKSKVGKQAVKVAEET